MRESVNSPPQQHNIATDASPEGKIAPPATFAQMFNTADPTASHEASPNISATSGRNGTDGSLETPASGQSQLNPGLTEQERTAESTSMSLQRREIGPNMSCCACHQQSSLLHGGNWAVPRGEDMPRFGGHPLMTLSWLQHMAVFFPPDAPAHYTSAIMLQRVPLLLEGVAGLWWRNQSTEVQKAWAYDWNLFRSAVLDYFLPDHDTLKLWESQRIWNYDAELIDINCLSRKCFCSWPFLASPTPCSATRSSRACLRRC